jgi:hypothetical protein
MPNQDFERADKELAPKRADHGAADSYGSEG